MSNLDLFDESCLETAYDGGIETGVVQFVQSADGKAAWSSYLVDAPFMVCIAIS